ncbi:cyclopropane-fatty-acyl-phospholipid synthase family protein [Clostridium sp. DJ247]|uniref:SAM-dependent methyltransferase n=1 Tax=Clostridium sp. DJ247 TaxID=2726188 RepID=UPI00162A00DF|nr:cyclopropane-fatty-acyl-phospholipid synthase family protein [Clostridium sp. DJ247]MBC2581054.1 class I SAM-dependent methyltransferase [Clostridium sp. DJ247]
MELDKVFLRKFLDGAFSDPVETKYWDGSIERYGDGDSRFTIFINEHIPKRNILKDPFLAFGEAYMNKVIDFKGNIQEIIESIYRNKNSFLNKAELFQKIYKLASHSISKSKKDIQYHYDLGNEFYSLWLDETMSYSCAYFKTKEDSLYEAQLNKIQHILKKLNLKNGERILDIGCGWGELIITAAKQYGVKALGITLSKEQFEKVKERIKENCLEDQVEVKLVDYRELAENNEQFDKIVSVGMLEHVGRKNLPVYMDTVNKLLKPEGVSLLHCITSQTESETNQWIQKYIFPGGYIPSVRELIGLMPDYNLHIVDLESLRLHYSKTLEYWAKNFEDAVDNVKKIKDEKFIRMWRLYLNSCAASFHYGVIDIHQFLFTKGLNNNIPMTREYIYDK